MSKTIARLLAFVLAMGAVCWVTIAVVPELHDQGALAWSEVLALVTILLCFLVYVVVMDTTKEE